MAEESETFPLLVLSDPDEHPLELNFDKPWISHHHAACDILGVLSSKNLFSAESYSGSLVIWSPDGTEGVNECAVRATDISDVRGDAVIFYPSKMARIHGISCIVGKKSCRIGKGGNNEQVNHSDFSASYLKDVPEDIWQSVFSQLEFADISNLVSVCRHWRDVVFSDEVLLLNLPIPTRIGKKRQISSPKSISDIPRLLLRAAEVGNVAAMEAVALAMESQGSLVEAMDWLKRAARKGHQGSQYRVGEAYYRGGSGLLRDSEEALLWLLRSFKNPAGECDSKSKAALLLGYMYLDGDGARVDNTEAVKWFKLASELGSLEARQTIGWLWNTGQY